MSGSFVLETLGAARDLGRLHDIASVLIRHGMGEVVQRLGIAPALERAGRMLGRSRAPALSKPPEQHFREALEELGPTFVKVGQILAGRSDLLPPAWTEELSRLHESATAVPTEEIRAQLIEDLGAPPEELFPGFDPEPLAAASIAQVHRAALPDGTPVVLKVRRPGIEAVVEADMRLFARLAELIESELPELRRYRPVRLARQLERSLARELDLRNEARDAARMAAQLTPERRLVIPRVHARWTRERLCVMDLLEGPSVGDWLRAGDFSALSRREAAAIGADAILEMVFVHGFFHADPHPGNVLVLTAEGQRGKLGLLDFGMIGTLADWRRVELLELLAAFAGRDDEGIADVLLDWSGDGGGADPRALLADVGALLERYAELSIGELDTTAFLRDLSALLRDNDLFLPDDMALLLKVFVTLDGLGKQLDPDFVAARHVAPFVRRALREHASPRALLSRNARQLSRFLQRLPRTLERAMAHARRGKLGVDIEVAQLERFGDQIARSANRVTIGLVTSALIVGTAISTTVTVGPHLWGMPVLAFLGFASSVAAGVWLLGSILRSRR